MNDDNNMNEEEMMEEEDSMVTLTDENGEDVQFEFLDVIEYDGNQYVVLLPAEETEEPGEVVILQIEDTDDDSDEESYISVDDETTLNTVFEIFKDKFKDEFNFVD